MTVIQVTFFTALRLSSHGASEELHPNAIFTFNHLHGMGTTRMQRLCDVNRSFPCLPLLDPQNM